MIHSFLLWGIPWFLAYLSSGQKWNFLRNHGWPELATWLADKTHPISIGTLLAIAFWWYGSKNLEQARKRQAEGIPWYSMSRGESVFGTESVMLNGLISFLIGSILFALAPPFGLFFLVSRLAGYFLFVQEQQSHYARYLDDMDAKILSGHLESALNGEETPRETQGLHCPLLLE